MRNDTQNVIIEKTLPISLKILNTLVNLKVEKNS